MKRHLIRPAALACLSVVVIFNAAPVASAADPSSNPTDRLIEPNPIHRL